MILDINTIFGGSSVEDEWKIFVVELFENLISVFVEGINQFLWNI